jgi:sigma-B regulation protein RsbU (phosphoserine phosphatase)
MQSSYSETANHFGTLDYYGEARPGVETGWEFFDFVPTGRQSLVCSIGKGNGSGAGASFLTMSLPALFRGVARRDPESLAAAVRDLNRTIYELSAADFHAAFFCARIDAGLGELQYVNAGFGPALLLSRSQPRARRLENTGTVLGLSLRVGFGERTAELQPGDLLLALSDGVTDGLSEEEIFHLVESSRQARPVELVNRILDASGGGGDRTAVAVRFQGRTANGTVEAEEVELVCAAA